MKRVFKIQLHSKYLVFKVLICFIINVWIYPHFFKFRILCSSHSLLARGRHSKQLILNMKKWSAEGGHRHSNSAPSLGVEQKCLPARVPKEQRDAGVPSLKKGAFECVTCFQEYHPKVLQHSMIYSYHFFDLIIPLG